MLRNVCKIVARNHQFIEKTQNIFKSPTVCYKQKQYIRCCCSNSTNLQVLKEWNFKEMEPFGKLVANSIPVSTLRIEPADPHVFPMQDRVSVKVCDASEQSKDVSDSSGETEEVNFGFNVQQENNSLVTLLNTGMSSIPINKQCIVNVPLKYALEVENSLCNLIQVQNLESTSVMINAMADCFIKDLKGGPINLESYNGNILSQGLLQGTITLVTHRSGTITVHKIQSQDLLAVTENGDLKMRAVYSETADIISNTGNIHLGDCHGKMVVRNGTGNVVIDSMDGDLSVEVRQGDVDVYLARPGKLHVTCGTGNINIKVPEDTKTSIDLRGTCIKLHDDLKVEDDGNNRTSPTGEYVTGTLSGPTQDDSLMSGTEELPSIHAYTQNGAITISAQSWIMSLKSLAKQ